MLGLLYQGHKCSKNTRAGNLVFFKTYGKFTVLARLLNAQLLHIQRPPSKRTARVLQAWESLCVLDKRGIMTRHSLFPNTVRRELLKRELLDLKMCFQKTLLTHCKCDRSMKTKMSSCSAHIGSSCHNFKECTREDTEFTYGVLWKVILWLTGRMYTSFTFIIYSIWDKKDGGDRLEKRINTAPHW